MDDLNTPLAAPEAKRRWLPSISAPQLLVGALALFLMAFMGWAVTVEDPLGGEPAVTVSLEANPAAAPKAEAKAGEGPSRYDGSPRTANEPVPPAEGAKTVTIIDGSSGKRQEVVIPGTPEKREAAPSLEDQLLESTRHGRIPKVVAGGPRSIDVYASPAAAAAQAATGARVALVIGGLGVSAHVTADAIARLPAAVTLAFVPYGANVVDLGKRARSRGHEVLLQVSMEPFDYPDNDPGPQTLLTSLPVEKNLDRLHWQMSRMQGYVGVMNFMGARFTATEKVLAPVLSDIAKRGLLYADDGSSARSLAGHVAAATNMPFAKADDVLDAVPTPAEIDRALSQLEAAAHRQGLAVGMATALPVSIDRIARWAKDAAQRGVTLVPVTTVALKPKSS